MGLAATLATVAGSLVLYLVLRPMEKRILAAREQRRQELGEQLQIDASRRRLAALRSAVLEQATAGAALAWRAAISEYLKPCFATEWALSGPAGLDSTVDRQLDISTPAHAKLRFMLDHMRGASIGIAGPRGAGKSTLLRAFCGEQVTRLGSRDALTVATSAPVDYQSRDFLLHLFASLCHRTIERLDTSYERSRWKDRVAPQSRSPHDLFRLLLWVALAGLFMSALMFIGSFSLAAATIERRLAAAAPVAAMASAAPAPRPGVAPAPAAVAVPASAQPPPRGGGSARVPLSMLLNEVGVTPGALFSASLVLLATALLLLAVVALKAARLNGAAAEATADRASPPFVFSFPWFSRLFKTFRTRAAPKTVDPLVREAQDWLAEIKFQQSYTVGWSGSLKMPLGVEGSLNQARSLAQLQMSMPEIADAFVHFLERIAARFVVLIGIDELDKIESDEKAQRFLNDIKVVFGVPDVFFLVSVSENAMSQFERRGLPFRDTFDSSFDDVIAVEPLDFDLARKMLAERVLGMPMQFQALCHAMSGGLARELVRAARDLVELTPQAGTAAPRDLASLGTALVERELKAKLRAAMSSVERLDASEERSLLFQRLHALGAQTVSAQGLYEMHRVLVAAEPPVRRRDSAPDAAVRQLRALSEEIGTYCLFLAAVLRFFDNGLDEHRLTRARQRGDIDLLAHALRLQSLNASLARAALEDFLRDIGRPFSASGALPVPGEG